MEEADVERLGIETGSVDVSASDFIPNPAKAGVPGTGVSGDQDDAFDEPDVERLGIETASGEVTAPDFIPRPAGVVEPGLQGPLGTLKGAVGTGSGTAEPSEDFVNESALGGVAVERLSMQEPWAIGGSGSGGTAAGKLREEKAGTVGSGTVKDRKSEVEASDEDERARQSEADVEGEPETDDVEDAEGDTDDVEDAEGEDLERGSGAGVGLRRTEKVRDFGKVAGGEAEEEDLEEEDLESKNGDTELGLFRDDVFLKDEL